MKRLLRLASTVVAGATIATLGGTGIASATPSVPIPPPSPTNPVKFVAPQPIASSQVLKTAPTAGTKGGTTLTLKTAKPVAVGDVLVVSSARGTKQVVKATAVRGATVDTVPVSAAYALGPGHFSGSGQLGTGSVLRLADGSTMQPSATASHTFSGSVHEVIPCGTGSVTVDGSLSVTPSITVSGDVGWHWYGVPYLEDASVSTGINEQANLTIRTQGPSTPASCAKNVTIASTSFDVPIGPIDATVTLSLKADGKATVQGATTFSVDQHFSGSAGISYDASTGLHTFHNTSKSISSSLSGAGTASAEGGLTANANVSFYDVVSGDLGLRAYAGVALTPYSLPAWRLYAGVQLNGDIKILGYTVVGGTIWDDEWNLLTPPGIPAVTLPTAHPGLPYSAQVPVIYGTAPYTFTVCCTLPAGLTMSPTGLISGTVPAGTPASDGAVVVTVRDAHGFTGSRLFFVPVGALAISTDSLTAMAGNFYAGHLAATGASGAVTWALTGGHLPTGLSLGSTGGIAGTPTSVGTSYFTVRATDSSGASVTKTLAFTVNKHVVCNIHVCTIPD